MSTTKGGRLYIAVALIVVVPPNLLFAGTAADCAGTITFSGDHLNSAIRSSVASVRLMP
jgi:hypothetical protein